MVVGLEIWMNTSGGRKAVKQLYMFARYVKLLVTAHLVGKAESKAKEKDYLELDL